MPRRTIYTSLAWYGRDEEIPRLRAVPVTEGLVIEQIVGEDASVPLVVFPWDAVRLWQEIGSAIPLRPFAEVYAPWPPEDDDEEEEPTP